MDKINERSDNNMNQILGRRIRSKNTLEMGKILGINETHIIVSFVEEEVPMPLRFETFLKNCDCDDETRNEVEKRERLNTLRQIRSNQEDN